MSVVAHSDNHKELLRLIPPVVGNLVVGAGLQILVAAQVGVAQADVLFAAQAPFLVLSAVVASLCTNVVMPRLARLEEGDRRHAWYAATRIVLPVLVLLCAAVAALQVSLAPLVIAARIANHPAFLMAVSWFAVGCFATCLSAYQMAQTLASQDGSGSEGSQLTGGIAALLASPPLVELFGVAGGASVLALRPIVAVMVEHRSMRRRRSPIESVAGRSTARVALFGGCGLLIPIYTVLKLSPLIDRTVLGHADASTLTVYVITVQVLGAALGVFEKIVTRRWLRRLTATLHPEEWASAYAGMMRRGVVAGAVVAIALALVTVTATSIASLLQPAPAAWFIGFVSLQIVFGVLAQLAAMPMYALNRLHTLSALALLSSSISIVARVAGFVTLGVPGLLGGVLLYSLLNAIFLHRANVREWVS